MPTDGRNIYGSGLLKLILDSISLLSRTHGITAVAVEALHSTCTTRYCNQVPTDGSNVWGFGLPQIVTGGSFRSSRTGAFCILSVPNWSCKLLSLTNPMRSNLTGVNGISDSNGLGCGVVSPEFVWFAAEAAFGVMMSGVFVFVALRFVRLDEVAVCVGVDTSGDSDLVAPNLLWFVTAAAVGAANFGDSEQTVPTAFVELFGRAGVDIKSDSDLVAPSMVWFATAAAVGVANFGESEQAAPTAFVAPSGSEIRWCKCWSIFSRPPAETPMLAFETNFGCCSALLFAWSPLTVSKRISLLSPSLCVQA